MSTLTSHFYANACWKSQLKEILKAIEDETNVIVRGDINSADGSEEETFINEKLQDNTSAYYQMRPHQQYRSS